MKLLHYFHQVIFYYFPTFLEECHCETVWAWAMSFAKEKTSCLISSNKKGLSCHNALFGSNVCLPKNQAFLMGFFE